MPVAGLFLFLGFVFCFSEQKQLTTGNQKGCGCIYYSFIRPLIEIVDEAEMAFFNGLELIAAFHCF
jgi:hypothetical protein